MKRESVDDEVPRWVCHTVKSGPQGCQQGAATEWPAFVFLRKVMLKGFKGMSKGKGKGKSGDIAKLKSIDKSLKAPARGNAANGFVLVSLSCSVPKWTPKPKELFILLRTHGRCGHMSSSKWSGPGLDVAF